MQHLPAEESVKEQADAIGTEAVSCYDLNITAVQPVAGETDCWTVFAQEGVFRLYLKEQMEYTLTLLQVWEYLQAQGFSRLAALQMTRDGDIAVNMNDKLAFLIEALEGRPGELALQSDSVELGRCLAELHVLSQGIQPLLVDPSDQSVLAEPSLARQREDLELFYTMARHRLYPTGFDRLFVDLYEAAARLADQTLEWLAESPFDQLEEEPCWTGLLLGSCRGRSFKVDDEGTLRVPCIRAIKWGLCVRDLAGLLDDLGVYTNWSPAAASRVLDAYSCVRHLHPEEKELMYWLGIFPTGIWEISCDYYKGRRRQEDPGAAEALRQEWQKTVNRMQYWHLLLGDELGYENRC